ncbi:hypothetical protein KAS31_03170 [Candidatus Parcubacteria bacterium]|nr:hypothetical protein [Candidatus Parcubacteria bacterium]
MPGEPRMPTGPTPEEQPIEPMETDTDLRDVVGRPNVEDTVLNKLDAGEDVESDENTEMTASEKNVLGWIEENGIEEGVNIDYNGMDAKVLKIDTSEKKISIHFYEPHEYDRDYSFEDIGQHIEFAKDHITVKNSEDPE